MRWGLHDRRCGPVPGRIGVVLRVDDGDSMWAGCGDRLRDAAAVRTVRLGRHPARGPRRPPAAKAAGGSVSSCAGAVGRSQDHRADPEPAWTPRRHEIEEAAARTQAGSIRVRLKIPPRRPADRESPGDRPGGSPTAGAMIAGRADPEARSPRHPQAMIVEPADPADRELARAVQEGAGRQGAGHPARPADRRGADAKVATGGPGRHRAPPFATSAPGSWSPRRSATPRTPSSIPAGGAILLTSTRRRPPDPRPRRGDPRRPQGRRDHRHRGDPLFERDQPGHRDS